MAPPSGKKPRAGRFSGNHQRGWLWGLHAVTETLSTGTWPAIEVFATQQAYDKSHPSFANLLSKNVPVTIVDAKRLELLTHSTEHQGLAARMGQFPYLAIDDVGPLLATEKTRSQPLVVICDRIQDSFNFGAILRCCEGAGVNGVIIGDRGQAEVTPHVARSSSGAVNHVPIARVSDLVAAAQLLKAKSMQIVAADSNTTTGLWESLLGKPTVLVIGSEATGISPELLQICDQRVCIPMHGRVTSLNAAVATGIMLYEIRRQQSLTVTR